MTHYLKFTHEQETVKYLLSCHKLTKLRKKELQILIGLLFDAVWVGGVKN